jgi:hypothetical protein
MGCGWHDGDEISYDQNIWGADPGDGPPALLLAEHFFDVFTSGFELGGMFVMDFSSADALLTYLPQSGVAGALNASLTDPTSSSSGVFGGQVAALRLNIDFADAGYTAGSAPIAFGDLTLCNLGATPGLDGSSLRQLQAIANTALGGGATPYALTDLSNLVNQVNSSFEGGFVSTFAQTNLVNGPCF